MREGEGDIWTLLHVRCLWYVKVTRPRGLKLSKDPRPEVLVWELPAKSVSSVSKIMQRSEYWICTLRGAWCIRVM